MTAIQQVALTLAMMIVLTNVMLFVGGYIPSDEVPVISSVLSTLQLDSPDSTTFQSGMVVQSSTSSTATPSFITTVLDFISDIPIIGEIITLFTLIYELIKTGAFGMVIVMAKMGLPGVIVVPVGAAFFLIFTIGLYEHILDFIRSRGGSK